MSYRDMTFCAGNGCVRFRCCHRALTPEIEARAEAQGLPIAQFGEPDELPCYLSPEEDAAERNATLEP